MMKYRVLALLPTLLLINSNDILAHDVVTVNGSTQGHQHVYQRQDYGKPLQQGHRFQSAGSSGTTLWGSNTRPAYGKSTVKRRGKIVNGQNPGHTQIKPKKYGYFTSDYGKAVKGYGKPVKNYGKPVRSYGKTALFK